MAKKQLKMSEIGYCRRNIGHVKERDLSTTLEVTITKNPLNRAGYFVYLKIFWANMVR